MRTLALALLVATLSPSQSFDVHIPDGDPTTGTCLGPPFALSGVGFSAYWVIGASSLGPQPALIEDIAFAPCASGQFSTTGFRMVMGHLSGPWVQMPSVAGGFVFDPGSLDGATVVHDESTHGPFSWSYIQDQWSPFGFSAAAIGTGFVWDGQRDIGISMTWALGNGGAALHVSPGGPLVSLAAFPVFYTGGKMRVTLRPYGALPSVQTVGSTTCLLAPGLKLVATNQPLMGQNLGFTLSSVVPSVPVLLYAAEATVPPTPFGSAGCQLHLDPVSATTFIANGFGPFPATLTHFNGHSWWFQVPNDPALAGATLAVQATAQTSQLYATNAIELVIN